MTPNLNYGMVKVFFALGKFPSLTFGSNRQQIMQVHHEHLHLPRKRFISAAPRSVLFIILFLAIALPISLIPSQLKRPCQEPFTNPVSPTTPLRNIQVESPIFQPPRNLRDVQAQYHSENDPLSQQLAKIRDVQNWRILGDDHHSGKTMYTHDKTQFSNEANIAFFLQLSESNIILAPRLLSRVWHPGNIYGIHFDAKIPKNKTDMFIAAIMSNSKLSNVIILPSVPVVYDGISDLLSTLDSITSLLTVSQNWDYYINLSGSDYPLVSATGIRRLLGMPQVHGSSISFVQFGDNSQEWGRRMRDRLGNLVFDLSLGFDHKSDEHLLLTKLRHPIVTADKVAIEIPKGAAWITGHRSFCEYASQSNTARRLTVMFANMKTASEHFFQTLTWNHNEFNKTTVRHSFRHVLFSFQGVTSGQHPYYLDRQLSNGIWEMWPTIAYSGDFFARKFQKPDSKLLDHIDTQKSGATDRASNMTAVSQSFELVKRHFFCMIDIHSPLLQEQISPCSWSGKYEKGCYKDPKKRCDGYFIEPPA